MSQLQLNMFITSGLESREKRRRRKQAAVLWDIGFSRQTVGLVYFPALHHDLR